MPPRLARGIASARASVWDEHLRTRDGTARPTSGRTCTTRPKSGRTCTTRPTSGRTYTTRPTSGRYSIGNKRTVIHDGEANLALQKCKQQGGTRREDTNGTASDKVRSLLYSFILY